MKNVDILLHRAKRLSGGLLPTIAILSYQDGEYRLICDLWNGKDKAKRKTSTHKTHQEAIEAYQAFLKRYKVPDIEAAAFVDFSDLMGGGE